MDKRYLMLFFLVSFLFLVFPGCASMKPKDTLNEGMRGQIIPVDSTGKEILYQKRENIVINCVPLKNGRLKEENSITFNPEPDGNFLVSLKSGEYSVEIFQKGFYVKSLNILVETDQIIDVGVVELTPRAPSAIRFSSL